jgi:hypothetical protein
MAPHLNLICSTENKIQKYDLCSHEEIDHLHDFGLESLYGVRYYGLVTF